MTYTAKLFPVWAGGKAGYLYTVEFEGEMIVERAREAVCDAARVLAGRGLSGRHKILDGKTGAVRLAIDIEKAAKLTVREDNARGPELVKHKPMPLRAKPLWVMK